MRFILLHSAISSYIAGVLMEKIQKISRYTLNAISLFIVMLPLIEVLMGAFVDSPFVKSLRESNMVTRNIEIPQGSTLDLNTVHWTPLTKGMTVLAHLFALLPALMGLFLLRGILKRYVDGDIFNTQNAKGYNHIAWLFFIKAILIKPLSASLEVMAATWFNPPRQFLITISFGTPNLELLFYGVLVIVVSWVMLEASKIHDEQKFVI